MTDRDKIRLVALALAVIGVIDAGSDPFGGAALVILGIAGLAVV